MRCHGERPGEEGVRLEEEVGRERVGGQRGEEGQEAGVPDGGEPEGEVGCGWVCVGLCVSNRRDWVVG